MPRSGSIQLPPGGVDNPARDLAARPTFYSRDASSRRDPRVDDYISHLPQWQQEVCQQIRNLAHVADEGVEETIKRSVQPYFVLDGNICALLAAKSHVNVFIYDPTVPDPAGLINQGHDNATAKAVQIREGDPIDQEAMLSLFRSVIANNQAGGWRHLAK